MNGLSDVRLLLRQEPVQCAAKNVRAHSAPQGLGLWGLMRHRLTTRRALLALNADQLRDIGLSAEQARAEGLKSFWQE